MKNVKTFEELDRKISPVDDLYHYDNKLSVIIDEYDIKYHKTVGKLYDIEFVVIDLYGDLVLLTIQDEYPIDIAGNFKDFIDDYIKTSTSDEVFDKKVKEYSDLLKLQTKLLDYGYAKKLM